MTKLINDHIVANPKLCLSDTGLLERISFLETVIKMQEEAGKEASRSLLKEKEIGETKSRFVSIASHEFRTYLTRIHLSASLIKDYQDRLDKQKITEHLDKIKLAVGDLTAILDDFLSVERIDAKKILPVYDQFDLELLTVEVIADMELLLKPGQLIKHQHIGAGSVVNLDKKMLKHCIVNLISNAMKYSGKAAIIHVTTTIQNDKFHIHVRDNGIGIPKADHKKLFNAFFRANNTSNIPGTGLGLNIVKRYTELMQGKITVKSTEDIGTIFMLSFPLSIT
jgi:two-component system sensor kinase FixL